MATSLAALLALLPSRVVTSPAVPKPGSSVPFAIEACQGEFRATAAGLADRDDLAIGLHGQRLDLGLAQAEVGRGLAAAKDHIEIAGTGQKAVFEVLKG